MNYETVFNPSEEIIAPIDKGFHEFNLAHLGEEIFSNFHRVLVTVRKDNGEVIGGIHGEMLSDWLHIKALWVAEKYLGAGIGRELLKQIEEAAMSKGFFGSHTETTDFQALDFYLKNGFEVFGELEGKPEGTTWYFIKKALV